MHQFSLRSSASSPAQAPASRRRPPQAATQRTSPRFMGAPPLWRLLESAAGADTPPACLRGRSSSEAKDAAADTGQGRDTRKKGGGGTLFGNTRLGSDCPALTDVGHEDMLNKEDRMDRIWESFNEEPRRMPSDKMRNAGKGTNDDAQRKDRALKVCYGDAEVLFRKGDGGRDNQVDRNGRQSLEVMLKLLKRMVLVQKSNSIRKVSAKLVKISTTK